MVDWCCSRHTMCTTWTLVVQKAEYVGYSGTPSVSAVLLPVYEWPALCGF